MALNTSQNRQTCPNCRLGGDYAFERVTLVTPNVPLREGVYDRSIERARVDTYRCVRCGWALGLPETAAPNITAVQTLSEQEKVQEAIHPVIKPRSK